MKKRCERCDHYRPGKIYEDKNGGEEIAFMVCGHPDHPGELYDESGCDDYEEDGMVPTGDDYDDEE